MSSAPGPIPALRHDPDQQSLFEIEPPAWEQDDQSEQLVATVVFATGPEQPFDYLVPERLRDRAELGRRVRVPLGKSDRLMTGYLVALAQRQVDPRVSSRWPRSSTSAAC